jgi:hypothetical protein
MKADFVRPLYQGDGEPRPASPPGPALADGIGATLHAPVRTVSPERG